MPDGLPIAWPEPPRQPAQINPIEALRGIAETKNLMNQNQMFQQEYAARGATGEVLRNAIDPQTGQLDPSRAEALLAQDPRTGWKAPEIVNQLEQRRLTQIQAASAKLDMGLKQINFVQNSLSTLSNLGPNITYDDVIEHAGRIVANLNAAGIKDGYGDAKNMALMLSQAPRSGPELAQWVNRALQQTMDAKQRADYLKGQIDSISAGGRTSLVQTAPTSTGGYASRELGGVMHAPTPESMNELVPQRTTESNWQSIPGATGPNQPYNVPRSSVLPMAGGSGVFQPSGGGEASQPRVPVGTAAPADGTVPAAGGGTVRTPPGARRMVPDAVGGVGGMGGTTPGSGAPGALPIAPMGRAPISLSGPTAGFSDYQTHAAQNAADVEQQINSTVFQMHGMLPRLEEMLRAIHETQAGGGANVRTEIARVGQFFNLPNGLVDKVAGGDLSAAEEFQKLAVQGTAESLRQAMAGSGKITNLEWEGFLKSNPNLETDPRAIEKIINFVKGVSEKYYNMQQAIPQYQQEIARGATGGRGMEGFMQWYSGREHAAGRLNFAPTYGVPQGTTQAGQLPHPSPGPSPALPLAQPQAGVSSTIAEQLRALLDKHLGAPNGR